MNRVDPTKVVRIRALDPWTEPEELEMKAIARKFPDIYQSPCQLGNIGRFKEITDLLSSKGIKKTTEQVRRAWKERFCPNIIATSILEKDRPAIERLYHKYPNQWSMIGIKFCKAQTSEHAFYPANAIKNYFHCNPLGKRIKATYTQMAESTEHLPLQKTTKKRKESPVSINQSFSLLPSLTDLTIYSSCSDKDQLQHPAIETIERNTSDTSSTTEPEEAFLLEEAPSPPFSFEIASIIQARVSQGEKLEEVLQEYAHENGYADLCNYFLFLQNNFSEILTIDIANTKKQLTSLEKRRIIFEKDIATLRQDLTVLRQNTEHNPIPDFLEPTFFTQDQLSFDTRNPFNENLTLSEIPSAEDNNPLLLMGETTFGKAAEIHEDSLSLLEDFSDEEFEDVTFN